MVKNESNAIGKNDTEHLEFRKAKYVTNLADFFGPITITIMKEVKLILLTITNIKRPNCMGKRIKNHMIGQLLPMTTLIDNPAPSANTSLTAVPRGGPTAEDERHRHHPVATCTPPSPLSPAGSRVQFPPL
jgi:hypothetical protein